MPERSAPAPGPAAEGAVPLYGEPRLAAAIRHCERLTHRHSRTFHLGARLFPAPKRDAVLAVYAACRAGDDAVDEAPDPGRAATRLDAWWAGIRAAFAGTPDPSDPVQLALAWAIRTYDLPQGAFEELAEGLRTDLRMDADPGVFELAHLSDLTTYCRQVGGTVGRMIVPIAGHDDPDAAVHDALALGEAMQITNVLRDVGEDLRQRDRLYLPRELMERHGVRRQDLAAGKVDDAYVRLLDDLASEADRRYHRAWRSIPGLHGRAAFAVGLAALNYQAIQRALRRNRYDNLRRRAHLSTAARWARVPAALARVQYARLRRYCPARPAAGA